MTIISVSPRDPLIIRDGRPFGAEGSNRLRSLSWPYPSTMAGALRTLLGTRLRGGAGDPFDDENMLQRLKEIVFSGPLPMSEDELYFPPPADILLSTDKPYSVLKPGAMRAGEGCNLPHPLLWPIEIEEDAKPLEKPAFWPASSLITWLSRHQLGVIPQGLTFTKEVRVHAAIDDCTGTVDEENPFSTEGLIISDVFLPQAERKGKSCTAHLVKRSAVSIGVKVKSNDPEITEIIDGLDTLSPFGGERRLSYFKKWTEAPPCWQCPPEVGQSLGDTKTVRMVLVTPAIFSGGWLPGWLEAGTLEGSPPGVNVKLRLKGGCIQRWRPVSGWSLERKSFGPKPIRRLVPAGSVYFFEVISGQSKDLAGLWLKPLSDALPDCRDGFGLAVWGVWKTEGRA